MPRHDIYHDQVRHALIKDGWTITHDPFTMAFGQMEPSCEDRLTNG
jgi:hypothetical protein